MIEEFPKFLKRLTTTASFITAGNRSSDIVKTDKENNTFKTIAFMS